MGSQVLQENRSSGAPNLNEDQGSVKAAWADTDSSSSTRRPRILASSRKLLIVRLNPNRLKLSARRVSTGWLTGRTGPSTADHLLDAASCVPQLSVEQRENLHIGRLVQAPLVEQTLTSQIGVDTY